MEYLDKIKEKVKSLKDEGKILQLIKFAKKELKKDPGNTYLKHELIDAYLLLGNLNQAEAVIVTLKPEEITVAFLENYIKALMNHGRFDEAVQLMEKLIDFVRGSEAYTAALLKLIAAKLAFRRYERLEEDFDGLLSSIENAEISEDFNKSISDFVEMMEVLLREDENPPWVEEKFVKFLQCLSLRSEIDRKVIQLGYYYVDYAKWAGDNEISDLTRTYILTLNEMREQEYDQSTAFHFYVLEYWLVNYSNIFLKDCALMEERYPLVYAQVKELKTSAEKDRRLLKREKVAAITREFAGKRANCLNGIEASKALQEMYEMMYDENGMLLEDSDDSFLGF